MRLVSLGASAAAIFGGMSAVGVTAASAAPVNTVNISPTSDSETATNPGNAQADNETCNPYTITVAPAQATTVAVQISQSAPQNTAAQNTAGDPTSEDLHIGFCDVDNFPQFQGPNDNTDQPSTTSVPSSSAGSDQNNSFCYPSNFTGFSNGDKASSSNPSGTGTAEPKSSTCTGYVTTNARGIVEIGVTSNLPGTMTVTAYADNNQNASPDNFEPQQSATKTWVDNNASTISCTPSSSTDPTYHDAVLICTVKTSANTGSLDQDVNFAITNTNGPDYADYGQGSGHVGTCQQENDPTTDAGEPFGRNSGDNGTYGVYACYYYNTGGTGTDNVYVWDDQNNDNAAQSGEPHTTVTRTFVNSAPNNAFTTVTCSPNAYSPQDGGHINPCEDPTTDKSVTLTGTVTASEGGAGVSGTIIYFYVDYTGNDINDNEGGSSYSGANDSFTPGAPEYEFVTPGSSEAGQCVTNSAGTCSVTFNHPVVNEGDYAEFDADVPVQTDTSTGDCYAFGIESFQDCYNHSNNTGGDAYKVWHKPDANAFVDEARTVTVSPATASQPSGGAESWKATVRDRFGNLVQGSCVGWTESGPGRFTNATGGNSQFCGNGNQHNYVFDTTCITNADGTCTVETTSLNTESGDETVTASIATDYSVFTYTQADGSSSQRAECLAPAGQTYFDTDFPYTNGFGPDSNTNTTQENDGLVVKGDLLGLPSAPSGVCSDTGVVSFGNGGGGSVSAPHITALSPSPSKANDIVTVTGTGTAGDSINVITFDHKHGTVTHRNAVTVGSGGNWTWQFQPNYTTTVGATQSNGSHTSGVSNTKKARVHQNLNVNSVKKTSHKKGGSWHYKLTGHSSSHINGETITLSDGNGVIATGTMDSHGNFTIHFQTSKSRSHYTLTVHGNGKNSDGTKYTLSSNHAKV